MEGKLEIFLLGRPQFCLGGDPVNGFKSVKAQALLSYLAVTGEPHNRSALAGLLWGSMSESNARMNLSQALTTLRRFFADYLTIERQTVRIKHDPQIWVDVEHFKSQLSGFPSTIDVHSLEEAAQTYRGDFLDGFCVRNVPEFEVWSLAEQTKLRELAKGTLNALALHYSDLGKTGRSKAIGYASQLLSFEPWDEGTHRLMMHLLALEDQRNAAIVQYKRCRQVLLEELGVEPAPETKTLYEQIRHGVYSPQSERGRSIKIAVEETTDLPDDRERTLERENLYTNIYAPPSGFVGRERELDSIGSLFTKADTRLVTLVGPGGIGKTRLALEYARRQVRQNVNIDQSPEQFIATYPDGVFFISLETLGNPKRIWNAIASAMHFRLDFVESQLLDYLGQKKLLLVIDNFEHLLEGAEILANILMSAPDVHILATSREPLKLTGETVIPLDGLEIPKTALAKHIVDYAAGKLFLQTARRQRPDFSLVGSEPEKVAIICQQVEGMPLALEIAATWTDALSLSNIASDIQRNLDFLTAKYRDRPSRHQSIRAAFDVSWERLLPSEKNLFANLSIFSGGFTREAATWIAGATPQNLAILVGKSLLRYNKSQNRYSIHVLLHHYAKEKFEERIKNPEEIKGRHSLYYLEWFGDQVTPNTLKVKGQKNVLDSMRDEIENTQAAWEWAIQKASLKHLRPVTTAFGLYYSWRGGIQEGEQVFQTFANQLIDSSKKQEPESIFLRSDILNWQAYFLYELGDRPKAIDLLLESLELINSPSMIKMDTRDVLAHNLANRSRAGWWQTSDERIELISLSRALYREVDHPFGLPDVLNTSANLSLVTGQLADAQRNYEESLQLNERAGNLLGKSSSMVGLGSLTFALNDYEKAEKILVQAVKISGVMEDLYRVASALLSLGCVYLHSGQFSHARRTLERCAADFTDMSLKNNVAVSLYYLGFACLHLGEYEQAAFYANAALPLALGTDYKEIIAQSMMLPAAIKLARGEYKEAVHGFEAANQVFISKRYTRILFGEDPGKLGQAAALLGLARQEEAKILLADQLRLAVDAHRMDSLLYGLVGAALLMARLGDGKSAIRLYTQACNYRFVTDSCWFSEAFGRHIKIACASLSTTEREAAVEKGKLSDIWETAGELIQILSINNR